MNTKLRFAAKCNQQRSRWCFALNVSQLHQLLHTWEKKVTLSPSQECAQITRLQSILWNGGLSPICWSSYSIHEILHWSPCDSKTKPEHNFVTSWLGATQAAGLCRQLQRLRDLLPFPNRLFGSQPEVAAVLLLLPLLELWQNHKEIITTTTSELLV